MASKPKKTITGVPLIILEILQKHPEGLNIEQIREIGKFEGQQHLDRRVRDLDPHFIIERTRSGTHTIYRLNGERPEGDYDYDVISKNLRAKILTRDGRRCRMCGKTIDEDFVKLHIDHKIPREWGGLTVEENLWSLCSGCNEGKKNYFASFDPELMNSVLGHASVHRRIAEILRLKLGKWVDCDLIEFVANFDDYQADWNKRLRELRYFDFQIESKNQKIGKRTLSYYRLNNWPENQPADLTAAARAFERKRASTNKLKNNPGA
ncbi:MAG: HNH endonuclease signature motif containing protein [Verrucomicrobiota bacterium]